jgi:plastocyanin
MSGSMNRSARTLVVGGAIAVLALAGCGSSSTKASSSSPSTSTSMSMSSSGSGSTAVAGTTITIKSYDFGQPLMVKPGQTINVVNDDSVPHTVTADAGGGFNARVGGNGKGTFTAPATAGTYAFHCSIHPDMHGSLVVAS